MKKIIALALALIMALSMASVAFAADMAPGETYSIPAYADQTAAQKANLKVSYDFTSSANGYKGASLVDEVKWVKDAVKSQAEGEPYYDLVIVIKENLTSTTDKDIKGVIKVYDKTTKLTDELPVGIFSVGNAVEYIAGEKKASEAATLTVGTEMEKNVVMYAEDGAGYVKFVNGSLTGTVKVEKDEKAQVYFAVYATEVAEDTQDAIADFLGEEFEGIVEYIVFEGTGFKNDVDFQYDAYEEDPHFFYVWDGEKFVDLEAKYDADEDVDDYVFTADAKGIILVSDVELVLAAEEDTKNPDTGANDVVGVAAALAVVSLVAAGAVSLKK